MLTVNKISGVSYYTLDNEPEYEKEKKYLWGLINLKTYEFDKNTPSIAEFMFNFASKLAYFLPNFILDHSSEKLEKQLSPYRHLQLPEGSVFMVENKESLDNLMDIFSSSDNHDAPTIFPVDADKDYRKGKIDEVIKSSEIYFRRGPDILYWEIYSQKSYEELVEIAQNINQSHGLNITE